ncbi:transposase [Streptomyces sp. NPDC093795]|uniref:transposase n=1 Tax=Streptomyces sp. NPDC093795 TaxID=3366051 RepID=UPI003821F51D
MITVHGSGRSHGRAGGGTGAVVSDGGQGGRPPVWPRRQLINGIRFRVRTGVPWRDVPRIPQWPTATFRPHRPPRTSHGRVRNQPPQEPPRRRHAVRQTRRPL